MFGLVEEWQVYLGQIDGFNRELTVLPSLAFEPGGNRRSLSPRTGADGENLQK
jgi:hypothetical protein